MSRLSLMTQIADFDEKDVEAMEKLLELAHAQRDRIVEQLKFQEVLIDLIKARIESLEGSPETDVAKAITASVIQPLRAAKS